MQITLPDDAGALAASQASAAGFSSVDDYVVEIIRSRGRAPRDISTRAEALKDLRELWKTMPKLSTQEIVDAVRDSRSDLK